ncbi:MAG: DEAD/DEAH box helicase [Saprospiraceae bacterium]
MQDFSGLGLSQPTLDAIEELGFETPTSIQAGAIPKLLNSQSDFVGLAQTGTGKTAAFGLPLIELVDASLPHTQALVLAPTRELCLQISTQLESYGKYRRKTKILAVYGGTDIGRQIRELRKGVHILVATPGRLRDLLERQSADISQISYLVLDEADEMLNMGFRAEIDEILESAPADRITWLFSATMSRDVRRIAKNYMHNPEELVVGDLNTSNKDIEHQYTLVRATEKYDILKNFLDAEEDIYGIIFCRTRRDTEKLAKMLDKDGYPADAIHGDLNQSQRDRVMELFRNRKVTLLVATDVAARGIDVNDISHVYHFNIPEDLNFYTHRSGRTGRAGKTGTSLILAHQREKTLIPQLERRLDIRFKHQNPPSVEMLLQRKLMAHIQAILDAPKNKVLDKVLPPLQQGLAAFSKEDLIYQIAASFVEKNPRYGMVNRPLPVIQPMSRDRDMDRDRDRGRGRDRDRDRGGSRKPGSFTRLFINLGTIDISQKGEFLGYICRSCNISGDFVGRIDMNEKYTFFDIEVDTADQVVQALDGADYQGRPLRVNQDRPINERKKRRGVGR